ncbi:MAG: hypothetical protein H6564_23750 [Lewinellaceae bacterium]|nr:hypothetical protein [Lewinellaceae bacterium]
MKRIALFCLWLSFFFCYMEWGKDQSAFVFEAAYQILFRQGDKASSFQHPLVLAPFVGQLFILIALFLKRPDRRLVWAGIILMGLLVFFVLLAGALSLNAKTILSVLPFIASAVWSVRLFRACLEASL